MVPIVILAGISIALGLVTFVTGRRFGALSLALAAGALLSSLWEDRLAAIVAEIPVTLAGISASELASIILVVAPAILLLLGGPSYATARGKLLGAVLFTVFTLVLVAEPLRHVLLSDATGKVLYETIVAYRPLIVTAGLAIGLFDMMTTRSGAASHKAKH